MEFLELTLAEISSCIKDVQETKVDADDVLKGTFGWVNHRPGERVDDMEDLMKKIQLLNCSGECLQNEIKVNEALLDRQPTVYTLLTQNLATIVHREVEERGREELGGEERGIEEREEEMQGSLSLVDKAMRTSGNLIRLWSL